MAFEATVTSKGQLTIPKAVRERLGIEPGQTVLFRFDEEGGVRLVNVPADPMERLDAAKERSAGLELDAEALIERERAKWNRPSDLPRLLGLAGVRPRWREAGHGA